MTGRTSNTLPAVDGEIEAKAAREPGREPARTIIVDAALRPVDPYADEPTAPHRRGGAA